MSSINALKVASIVRDAGGKVVGRTRLQKVTYLLTAAGLESGMSFIYKHYGPYSEDLTYAAREARMDGILNESEQQAGWGGTYSIFSTNVDGFSTLTDPRHRLAKEAAEADAVELELAATALFLFKEEGNLHPWDETARRKPEKAENGRLEKAKLLYASLKNIPTPVPCPVLE